MARKLDVKKRISLTGVSDGWGDECYVVTTLYAYGELKAITSLDENDGDAGIEAIYAFVRDHFVSGKAMFLNDAGVPELQNMTKDDFNVDTMAFEVVNHIYEAMLGAGDKYRDPKASETPTAQSV